MLKVAINGFGRIGRLTFRKIFGDDRFEVVAINDLTEPKMLAHLLKYDSVQGPFSEHTVHIDENSLIIDGKKIRVHKDADPKNLPWNSYGVDIVLECTGFFCSKAKSQAHIDAGAKRVLISAPAGNDLPTIVYGVNHHTLKNDDIIVSGAS
ncbi:MAG: glyceraldehyde 3-phosphate dehydrogenase N-terminal domain-containing protein, partial [Desulfobacterales bacterium]